MDDIYFLDCTVMTYALNLRFVYARVRSRARAPAPIHTKYYINQPFHCDRTLFLHKSPILLVILIAYASVFAFACVRVCACVCCRCLCGFILMCY